MFLDIGLGIIGAIMASLLFQADLSVSIIAWSVLLALLPDIDFLAYSFILRRGADHRHRDLIHYPLLYLPIGTVILWLWAGAFWASLFLALSLAHFIHDSIGIGWGVKWLFPFSRDSFVFLYRPPEKDRRRWVYAFQADELPAMVEKHGDPHWLKNLYLNRRYLTSTEIRFFLLALASLLVYYAVH